MNYPKTDLKWNGQHSTLWWIRTDDIGRYTPVKQVYGICFNEKGEILICRSSESASWQIPGGHPENNERVEETLRREFLEEVDVSLKEVLPLGVQKVEFENNTEHFYQVRCVCTIDQLLPQTQDPANGNMWMRMFVSQNKITHYVQWGDAGDAMFKDAIEMWLKRYSKNH